MDWHRFIPALIPFLLLATGLWAGALLCVGFLARRARFMADGPEIGRIGLSIFRRSAWPALLASCAAGAACFAYSPRAYVHERSFYVVTALAAVMIALHVRVGAKAKRVADGDVRAMKGRGVLAAEVSSRA